jgi:hypothetical protein
MHTISTIHPQDLDVGKFPCEYKENEALVAKKIEQIKEEYYE